MDAVRNNLSSLMKDVPWLWLEELIESPTGIRYC